MIKEMFLSQDKLNLKAPYSMVPKGICIHNTYNDAPAINERNNVNRPENMDKTSFHIAVDDKEAIQLIPFNRNAFHAGDGGDGNGNRNFIAVEICYSLSGGQRFEAAEARAVDVVAELCKQFRFTTENIKPHRFFSVKNCPHRTDIDSLIQRVGQKLLASAPIPSPSPITGIQEGDAVKVTGTKYSTGETIPSWVKDKSHTIQQFRNNKSEALLREIQSWVYTKDIYKVGSTPSIPSQPATTAPTKKYGIVTAQSGLNVRKGAGTNYPILGALRYGEKIRLDVKVGEWWSIYWGDHGGFVSAKYIKEE